jgi:EmrB/QacA subfamily drug resistance transporter
MTTTVTAAQTDQRDRATPANGRTAPANGRTAPAHVRTAPANDRPIPARHPRRWLILAIVLVAELMDLIDGTIVNVAAPAIRRDLGGSQSTLQWFGAAYTLAFAVLLITGGRLGDRVGRRRLFMIGVVGFTTASAACAAAPSAPVLIAFRVLQGAFGALLIPQGFGVIKEVFAEDEIQKAFAAFGPVIGIAAVISPVVGGALTSGNLLGLGWRSVFLVNIPLGVAGLIGAIRVMPRTGGRPGTRLDPGGALFVTLSSFALVFPLVQGRELGWPAWVFVLLGAGVVGFLAFGRYERKHEERALIAPSLLRNRAFTSGLVVAVCFFATMIGLSLVLSLFCQLGEGFSPLRTGLTLAPFAVGVAITAGPSYPLARRYGRGSLQAGLVVMGAGLALLALMISGAGHPSSWTLVPGELLAGMGMGIALPPLFDFILAGVREHEVGSASGVLNASQQFAGALGIAVFATVFFSYFDAHRPPTGSAAETILLTLIPLALAFLGVFRLPRRAREGPDG